MGCIRLTLRVAFALFLFLLASERGFAQDEFPPPPKAALLDFKLALDGPADAASDRLVGDVLFYPGTDQVDLVVEADAQSIIFPPAAEVPPASRGAQPAQVMFEPVPPTLTVRPLGAGEASRGSDGRYQIRTTVKRPEKGRIAQAVVVVPHAALALRPDDQTIRYTMRGEVGGTEAFFKALPVPRPEDRIPPPALVLAPAADQAAAQSTGEARPLPTPQVPSKTLPPAMPFPEAPSKSFPAAPSATYGGGEYSPPSAAAPAPRGPTVEPFEAQKKRAVLFATNRTVRAASGTPSERFGDERDENLHYGSCLVNIPVDAHIAGKLELPGFFSRRDPEKYFLIDATSALELPQFLAIVGGGDSRRDTLVYVHGFNTTFDFAVMRLAQVVHDIQFAGAPVAFSWPSHGSAFAYGRDQDNAEKSVAALVDTLRKVIDVQAARPAAERGKVHVLAHSLGNRVTLRALAALDSQLPAGATPFGQIILAAPDVSIAEFEQEVPAAHRLADRVSLYFCPQDEALLASEAYHPGEPRAGRGVVPIDDLDNIDARKANTSFLGHGYWADEKQLLIDLQMLVNFGLPPIERIYTLEAAVQPLPQHWRFK